MEQIVKRRLELVIFDDRVEQPRVVVEGFEILRKGTPVVPGESYVRFVLALGFLELLLVGCSNGTAHLLNGTEEVVGVPVETPLRAALQLFERLDGEALRDEVDFGVIGEEIPNGC